MVTPDAKRKAVVHAGEVHGVSQRRACQALNVDRSTVRYTSTRPDDALLREAMKAVAAERRRFGYRRIHIMLDRKGIVMNQKKLRRLYREEKLQVRRRGGRKRALGTRRPMLVPDRANSRWSLDFVSDTFTDGRRFRVLAVVDDYTRECLALVADTSLSGLRLVRELDAVIRRRGPACHDRLRQRHGADLDSGPEVVPADRHRMALHRARKTHTKCLHRELQRPLQGRVPQRYPVLDTARGPQRHHLMEGGLQPP
jgi:transposase InsO family protein